MNNDEIVIYFFDTQTQKYYEPIVITPPEGQDHGEATLSILRAIFRYSYRSGAALQYWDAKGDVHILPPAVMERCEIQMKGVSFPIFSKISAAY